MTFHWNGAPIVTLFLGDPKDEWRLANHITTYRNRGETREQVWNKPVRRMYGVVFGMGTFVGVIRCEDGFMTTRILPNSEIDPDA